MKFSNLVVINSFLLLSFNSFAIADCKNVDNEEVSFSKDEKIQKQTIEIYNFLNKNLPEPVLKDGYESTYEIVGKTKDGKKCGLRNSSTEGYIFIEFSDHPKMPKDNLSYHNVSFSWDYNEMTNIFGMEVIPKLSISQNNLDAKVTVATGYGISKYHLIISKQGNETTLKMRNRGSVFGNYLECTFKK